MKRLLVIVPFLTALIVPVSAFSEPIEIEITEVPYNQPHAFLTLYGKLGMVGLKDSLGGSVTAPFRGLGLEMFSARQSNLQFASEPYCVFIDGTKLKKPDAKNIISLGWRLGARILPRYPTFHLGSGVAGRLTGSVLAGGGFWNTGGAGVSLTATLGTFFSLGSDPDGLKLELFSDLSNYSFNVDGSTTRVGDPSFGLAISFVFAP